MQKVGSLYLKLRSRYTIYFFLLVFLPCIIVSAVAYLHVRSLAEEKAYNAALSRISQEKTSIVKYIGELKLAISAAENAFGFMAHNSGSGTVGAGTESLSFLLANAIERYLTQGQLRALTGVYLMTGGKIKASYGSYADTAAINSPSSQQWYKDAVGNPDIVNVLGTMQRFYTGGKSKVVFCLAKSLSDPSGKNAQSVLLFDFDYSLLADFTGSAASAVNTDSQRLIIDFGGNILLSRDQGKLTTPVDEVVQEAVGNLDKGCKRIIYDNGNYYMTYVRYPELSWTFIDLNPVSNVSDRLWLRNPFIIVCIFALPAALFIYLAASLSLLKPINELAAVISDYGNQLPGTIGQSPLLRRKLPLAGVDGSSDIDLLINKIYSIKLSQKEAELNSLQNQINPHFLYNTLESIRGAALYHGINDIAAMSKAMSLLFRYSIGEQVLVSIKDELSHLENYISIQNFRYENKFDLLYSIPPELMNHKILKLTLQPLI